MKKIFAVNFMPNYPPSGTSQYDDEANRLVNAGGVNYTWDANGNLLNDGTNAYTYNAANRLVSVVSAEGPTFYQYNGLGDRVKQNGTVYTLDINTGLTQVLSDGTNTYTYGLSRISQSATDTEYFLGDALGSVRQLTDDGGAVTLAKSYAPYGESMVSAGEGQSAYGFTGEQQDASGLTYLRARYYNAADGRFLNRDTWDGNGRAPLSLNRWNYVQSNPINYADPSGLCVNCYIFYFTGAGNVGDIDGSGAIDTEMLPDEQAFIAELGRRTGAKVISVYPYGIGLGPNPINDPLGTVNGIPIDSNRNLRDAVFPAAYQQGSIPRYKAEEIVGHLLGEPYMCHDDIEYGKGKFNDASINVMFLGYSGGGQMAYSTAQKLKGILKVDNVVMFGAPFRAHSGLGNIGHLWSFVSPNDNFYKFSQLLSVGIDSIYDPKANPNQKSVSWDIQNLSMYAFQNATFCVTKGGLQPSGPLDLFSDHMSYFNRGVVFSGYSCFGRSDNQVEAKYQYSASRFDAHVNTVVDIMEGNIK